jgi:hypothetical protein
MKKVRFGVSVFEVEGAIGLERRSTQEFVLVASRRLGLHRGE